MRGLVRAMIAAFCLLVTIAVAEDFPPIGSRYDTISEDVRAIIKALKKLEARTEIGVNFVDYDRAVSEIYPDVKVFLESNSVEETVIDGWDGVENQKKKAEQIACDQAIRLIEKY
jgi:hypothetical protein